MNQDIWNGKWLEVKGEILNHWGKLIGDDLDRVKGNVVAIAGLVEQKYGIAKEQIVAKIDELRAGATNEVVDSKDSVVEAAADGTEAAKKSVRNSMN